MLTPEVVEVTRAGGHFIAPREVVIVRDAGSASAPDDPHARRGDGTRTRAARQRSRDLRSARAAKRATR